MDIIAKEKDTLVFIEVKTRTSTEFGLPQLAVTERGFQQDFPVVERDRVVGILTRGALIHALSTDGPEAPVERRMTREFETAHATEMLEPAFARLQACSCHTAIVTHEGRLAGLLTMDNLGEFVMIQSALR